MEKKQTAVDSFVKKLKKQGLLITEDSEFIVAYLEAKQMEKEQIIDLFVECWKENMPEGYECKQSAEYYYNETYGGKDEH